MQQHQGSPFNRRESSAYNPRQARFKRPTARGAPQRVAQPPTAQREKLTLMVALKHCASLKVKGLRCGAAERGRLRAQQPARVAYRKPSPSGCSNACPTAFPAARQRGSAGGYHCAKSRLVYEGRLCVHNAPARGRLRAQQPARDTCRKPSPAAAPKPAPTVPPRCARTRQRGGAPLRKLAPYTT